MVVFLKSCLNLFDHNNRVLTKVTKNQSLYLDLIRVFASFLVLLGHFSYASFSGGYFGLFSLFKHDAVMLFFVLSGYVIAFVSDKKDFTFLEFWISRFSRLYSVVIPALFITLIADQVGMFFNSDIYLDKAQYANPFVRFFANFSFIQQIWFLDIRPFSNGPFWSLSYEFWYYVLFSVLFYFSGGKRIILVFLVALIVGPKILILAPAWFLGAAVYKSRVVFNGSVCLVLFMLTPILYVAFKLYLYKIIPVFDFGASSLFLSDYVVAMIFSLHLIAAKFVLELKVSSGIIQYPIIKSTIRWLSSSAFSMYLYHFPLLLMWCAVLNTDTSDIKEILFLLVTTLSSIFVISGFTEGRRQAYKVSIMKIFSVFQNSRSK